MKIPFTQRMGYQESKPVDRDFPDTAKTALFFILHDLNEKGYIRKANSQDWLDNWLPTITEIRRTGRINEFDYKPFQTSDDVVKKLIKMLQWDQLFIFCERVYEILLIPKVEYEYDDLIENYIKNEYTSIDEVKKYYSTQINTLLDEENMAYTFVDGEFNRRGYAQTQVNIKRVGKVLANPDFFKVKNHFNKAKNFFDQIPDPDNENCIKEAICSLEATIEFFVENYKSKGFSKAIEFLQGTDKNQIPSPITQSIIKLYSYRGSGEGVAHSATGGNSVNGEEAELVLSLVATYITYLYDKLYYPEEEIPF